MKVCEEVILVEGDEGKSIIVPFVFVGLSRKIELFVVTIARRNQIGRRFKSGNNRSQRQEARRLIILPSERRKQPQHRPTSKKDEAQLKENDPTTRKIPRLVAIYFEGVGSFRSQALPLSLNLLAEMDRVSHS